MPDDTISLEFIGALLRQIQAEQRILRDEMALMRREMESDRTDVRALMHELLTVLAGRIGNFEAVVG